MNARPIAEHGRRPILPEPPPVRALTQLAAYPWLVVCVACLGAFAGQVDASIVQLSLPNLESAFDSPLNEVSWVAVAYSLSFAAVLPIFARLAEIAGGPSTDWGDHAALAKAGPASAIRSNRCPNPAPSVPL